MKSQDIKRKAKAIWSGDLRSGKGNINTESGVLKQVSYSFATRFINEKEKGTNPEELIAAAHAGCYSMAFANTLSGKGYKPEKIETNATCTLSKQEEGFRVTHMRLEVKGTIPDIDEKTLQEIAEEADKGCPVSNLLRNGLEIELSVSLA
jgi:osmotically inducible protein OsmC